MNNHANRESLNRKDMVILCLAFTGRLNDYPVARSTITIDTLLEVPSAPMG